MVQQKLINKNSFRKKKKNEINGVVNFSPLCHVFTWLLQNKNFHSYEAVLIAKHGNFIFRFVFRFSNRRA